MDHEHEHTIGLLYGYDEAHLVTLSELMESVYEDYYLDSLRFEFGYGETESPDKSREEMLKKYFDFRYSTNLTRFLNCPYCGEKIDWKKMKNEVLK